MKSYPVLIVQTLSVALAILGVTIAPARAGTTPYTEALISTFNPNESVTPIAVNSSPPTASVLDYSTSGQWGSVSAYAAASLSTGQLKVAASDNPQPGSYPYMQSNAWFGDGFRATDAQGGAFNWLPNTGASFTLDLSGSIVSASDPQLSNVGYGVGAFIMLSLFKPGTLDPSGPLVNGDNSLGYYLYLLGNPDQNLIYSDGHGGYSSLLPTAYYGNLRQNIHIQQDFQPGGDFDWVVLMGISGQVGGPQYYNIDLSHTLTVGYNGPAGSTTTSVSGLFNNFNLDATAVPEPGCVVLVASGAIALLGHRAVSRNRRNK